MGNWDTLHHVDELVVVDDPVVVLVAVAHQLVDFPILDNFYQKPQETS